jgi:hypothetical protein
MTIEIRTANDMGFFINKDDSFYGFFPNGEKVQLKSEAKGFQILKGWDIDEVVHVEGPDPIKVQSGNAVQLDHGTIARSI